MLVIEVHSARAEPRPEWPSTLLCNGSPLRSEVLTQGETGPQPVAVATALPDVALCVLISMLAHDLP